MARTRKKPPEERPLLTIHSVTLTAEESAILRRLSSSATDFLGRSISNSAVIRALLRQIDKQGPPAADTLFIEIENELKGGVRWGKQL